MTYYVSLENIVALDVGGPERAMTAAAELIQEYCENYLRGRSDFLPIFHVEWEDDD